ncbi:MAG TPA: response regulator transcription factor [Ktedonobacterales bacterium]
MNILVVDSDRDMVEMVSTWLRSRGNTVHFCYSVDKARAAWLERKPDLVIAEIDAPGVNILDIFREARAQHDALVLATTEEPSARLEAFCLESGADGFLAKPFLPKLLLAHIHALGRRVRSTVQRQPTSVFTLGPIRFDASRNEVRVNGKLQHLTPTESRILQVLAINAGDVCSQSQIVAHAWGYGEDGDTYLIKAHIRNLREKIESVPSKPRFIRTVPGVGYTLTVGAAITSEDENTMSASQSEVDQAPERAVFLDEVDSQDSDTSDAETDMDYRRPLHQDATSRVAQSPLADFPTAVRSRVVAAQ